VLIKEETYSSSRRGILQYFYIFDYLLYIEVFYRTQGSPYLFPASAPIGAMQYIHKRPLKVCHPDFYV
jgi:hypothetical protein